MSAELHTLVLARPSTALQGGAAVDRDPISPSVPVLNSACPWASSYEDLVSLYESPWTSAVTTRTATLTGFQEDAAIHKVRPLLRVLTCNTAQGFGHDMDSSLSLQVAFFSTSNAGPSTSTINSYGYSPFPLATYVDWVRTILSQANNVKPIIISISDSLSNLPALLEEISVLRASLNDSTAPRVGVEFNASCPNIPGYPPPSYDGDELAKYLEVLASYVRKDPTLTIGVKLPPYVYQGQFDAVIRALKSIKGASSTRHPISFLTCTNTLGNGLVFGDQTDGRTADFAVPTAFGGLGGETIHQISLGSVTSLLFHMHLNNRCALTWLAY